MDTWRVVERFVAVCLASILGASPASLRAQDETFETAEPRYRAMLSRPSMNR